MTPVGTCTAPIGKVRKTAIAATTGATSTARASSGTSGIATRTAGD
jgi:hypothetical protein